MNRNRFAWLLAISVAAATSVPAPAATPQEIADTVSQERLHAIVETSGEWNDENSFLKVVGERLSGLKRLRSVEFTRDPIRDEAGKVRRSALRSARVG